MLVVLVVITIIVIMPVLIAEFTSKTCAKRQKSHLENESKRSAGRAAWRPLQRKTMVRFRPCRARRRSVHALASSWPLPPAWRAPVRAIDYGLGR